MIYYRDRSMHADPVGVDPEPTRENNWIRNPEVYGPVSIARITLLHAAERSKEKYNDLLA